ncbi:hypothetical protein COU77_02725 [Candidatus Peregrinibacteria bacterium CG10_big_fil_rev_8_21_14_0_10_49_16]|nr:MAG: hypothetical protein COW95_02235 [Candidatus Peregrinibacteria bacterium CG22_combo_CG10-13_8_21_14_all_49_11]PIR51953.1 MAG: hypothetical protein COU77_02725 [Candidatus Peregrinibacteria bacterium CG10_big_fil_rev_8_21_14_0_10_49_16]
MNLSRPDRECLAHELDQFDPTLPLDRAQRPPVSWFLDPWMFQLQQRYIFRRTWQIAALQDGISEPESVCCIQIAGHPMVLVRDREGVLRAFPNSCTHWGTQLFDADCASTERIQCPNHRWTWNLKGELRIAPDTPDGFCRAGMHNLKSFPVREWGPFVWVCMDSDPPDFAETMGSLYERGSHFAAMEYAGKDTHDIHASWLHVMDNYNDGLYHRSAHPSLAATISPDYRVEVSSHFALQYAPFKQESGTVRSGTARYWSLFPNTMFNESGDRVLDVNVVEPVAPDRCMLHFYYFFAKDVGSSFREDSTRSSRETQGEDNVLCARIRGGLSLSYDRPGSYVPDKEAAVFRWHQLVHEHLLPAAYPPSDELL